MKQDDATRAAGSSAPACSACRWWRRDAKTKDVGICHDAIKRARMVVPFAVNLSESMIFAWGGKDCPCFEPNAPITGGGSRPVHGLVGGTSDESDGSDQGEREV